LRQLLRWYLHAVDFALPIAFVGVAWCLLAFSVPFPYIAPWAIVSIAILFLVAWQRLLAQRYLDAERRPGPVASADFERSLARIQLEQFRAYATQNLVAIAILLASAFALIWVTRGVSPAPVQHVQISPTGGGTGEPTIHFRRDLEDALAAYLNRPQAPSAPSEPWWHFITWPLAIAAVGVAFAIALLVRQRPAAAAAVGAGGLAEMLIANFDPLSRGTGAPNWWTDWLFRVGLFLIVAGALRVLVAAIREASTVEKHTQDGADSHRTMRKNFPGILGAIWRNLQKGTGGSGIELLFTFGFSLLILAWAMRSVPKVNPSSPQHDAPNGPSSTSTEKIALDPMQLPKINFAKPGPGQLDQPEYPVQIAHLKDDLGRQMRKGDMLLLLGSTDCPRINPSAGNLKDNDALALRRAGTVEGLLQPLVQAHQASSNLLALKQANGCKAAPNLRTVTPYLIHTEIEAQAAGH
jgi:hypothetical protein